LQSHSHLKVFRFDVPSVFTFSQIAPDVVNIEINCGVVTQLSSQPLPHITVLHRINMQAAWILLACLGAVNAASGVVEVDLVFPRNDTYTPSGTFPLIFAFQNPELAPSLNPQISVIIRNMDDNLQTGKEPSYDMRWANFSSSNPYYELRVLNFDTEARWKLDWDVSWDSCTEDSLNSSLRGYGKPITTNRTSRGLMFTINNSGRKVDLIAATTNRNCSDSEGVAISIATTLPVPENFDWDFANGNNRTCASMASTTPAPTPCRVQFDSTADLSMSSAISSRVCRATRKTGDSCPSDEEKGAAEHLTGGVTAGLVALFGALGYFVF
jgi:hypothetical protein